MFQSRRRARTGTPYAAIMLATVLAVLLAGCGGGASGGCNRLDAARDPSLPSCAGTPSDPGTPATGTALTLSLKDSAGGTITSVASDRVGVLRALVLDSKGGALSGVNVVFVTTDTTSVLVPTTGSALSDANGVAQIKLPAGTVAGAYTIRASAVIEGKNASASLSYSVSTPIAPLSLALRDAAGAPITAITPQRAGVLQATLMDSNGAALPNVAVTFTTSDKSGGFNPSSGTALSNANGVAQVGLPVGTQAGAYTATATARIGALNASVNTAYSVTFPTLSLGPLRIAPTTISAGGSASISVGVYDGASLFAPPLAMSFSSPCALAGKASITAAVTQAGVATSTYTDKGCAASDVVTASVTLAGTTTSRGESINVLPATVGSIKFVNADTNNIALKGTGGFGRQEFSTLTFQIIDKAGKASAGNLVDFSLADAGASSTTGVTLLPASAVSDANGIVTTVVASGAIPTSVRVMAAIRASTPLITTLSNLLVVSTGVPDQAHFSLSTSIGNCEGRDFDQYCSTVTASLGDHFGNPAPDGTAVNFSANGGLIDASCVTGSVLQPDPLRPTPIGQTTNSKVGPGSGTCSVRLWASAPRAASGRVTVLAYALGEENFNDLNGNNVFNSGEPFSDKSPDIFRDDNENGAWSPGEPCIGPNLNGSCSTPGDGQYNGVLRSPQVPSSQTLYVASQYVQIFSGSDAVVTTNPAALVCPGGASADLQITVKDVAGNLMPAGTTIEYSALIGSATTATFPVKNVVPNVVLGIGQAAIVPNYPVTVICDPLATKAGKLFVTVRTPSGRATTVSVPIN
jgi:hypothetical protein